MGKHPQRSDCRCLWGYWSERQYSWPLNHTSLNFASLLRCGFFFYRKYYGTRLFVLNWLNSWVQNNEYRGTTCRKDPAIGYRWIFQLYRGPGPLTPPSPSSRLNYFLGHWPICSWFNRKSFNTKYFEDSWVHPGTSLEVQCLRLHASTAGSGVPSLVRELKSCMLCVAANEEKGKKKKKKVHPVSTN